MIQQVEFTLKPVACGFHLITQEVVRHLPQLPEKGLLHLFVKHTSCGLCINENADRSLYRRSMIRQSHLLWSVR